MAKITRKKLARGTKLMPEHVFDPLTDAASELSNVNIERDQMRAPMAPFCVNLTVPYLSVDAGIPGRHTIPFVLPPTQDFFTTAANAAGQKDPQYAALVPQVKLTSVSFSFDQRDEPAAIASQFWGQSAPSGASTDFAKYAYSAEQGKLTYDDVTKLDIHLSLAEKAQSYFGDVYPYTLQRELWSAVLPSTNFSGRSLRINPFIHAGLDITVDQYKTMVFTIYCPGVKDSSGRELALPSIEVSLRFTAELMPRDRGETAVQNIPVDGGSGDNKYGAKTGPTVTINTPTASSYLEADTTDGVNYNITTIDTEFENKLEGGYNRYGDVPPTEVIKDDAAYDIIAVPLYQNAALGGIGTANPFFATWPYVGSSASPIASRGLFDRRLVPIHHSYTIHHVVLAWNWSTFNPLNYRADDSGTWPTAPITSVNATALAPAFIAPSEDLGLKIGVGIGTGARGDGFGYSEIATLAITDPNNAASNPTTPDTTGTWDTHLIDRIRSSTSPPSAYLVSPSDTSKWRVFDKWDWELHSVPLVAATPGAGYYAQGDPAFVGPGWSTTQSRTDLGSGAPPTAGAEQWIEVRSLLYPTTATAIPELDMYPQKASPAGGGGSSLVGKKLKDRSGILVGYQGCYVYLICKKHLTR